MRNILQRRMGMQPRQRFPVQGGMMMGQGPFAGHGQMMSPFGGRRQMMGSQRQFSGGNQMMGGPQARRSGGGLLSKIIGGKSSAGSGGSRIASGGSGGVGSILKSLSNPTNLSGFLNNTQQVLKTAQSIGPMIQQYGPLVKNLPAMWKLYKGLKDAPSGETMVESSTTSSELEAESTTTTSRNKKTAKKITKPQSEVVENRNPRNGSSVPKLYI